MLVYEDDEGCVRGRLRMMPPACVCADGERKQGFLGSVFEARCLLLHASGTSRVQSLDESEHCYCLGANLEVGDITKA